MTQEQVAAKLGWHQSSIASIETGHRRIDVLEYLKLAEAIGFDPCKLLKTIHGIER